MNLRLPCIICENGDPYSNIVCDDCECKIEHRKETHEAMVELVLDGQELNFTVDEFSYGGFNVKFATMPILDHPTMFKYTNIVKYAYWIPYDMRVPVYGAGYDPAMRVRYIPNPLPYGNDLIGESHTGALSQVNPTGTVQEWKTVYTSRQGFEFIAPQFALRQQVY